MKTTTSIVTAAITSLLFVSCKSEKTESTQAAATPEKCIVSGEPLGEMGEPFEYTYQDKKLKFCCKNCVPDFEKDPAKYIAKLK